MKALHRPAQEDARNRAGVKRATSLLSCPPFSQQALYLRKTAPCWAVVLPVAGLCVSLSVPSSFSSPVLVAISPYEHLPSAHTINCPAFRATQSFTSLARHQHSSLNSIQKTPPPLRFEGAPDSRTQPGYRGDGGRARVPRESQTCPHSPGMVPPAGQGQPASWLLGCTPSQLFPALLGA